MTASCTTRSASAAASASPSGEPLYVVHLDADRGARHRRPARGAGDAQGLSARRQLAGRRRRWPLSRPTASTSSPRCARRGRPRPAMLHRDAARGLGRTQPTANPASRPARPACSTATTATPPASRRRLHRALGARPGSRGHAGKAGARPPAQVPAAVAAPKVSDVDDGAGGQDPQHRDRLVAAGARLLARFDATDEVLAVRASAACPARPAHRPARWP